MSSATGSVPIEIRRVRHAAELDPRLRAGLIDCWVEVTRHGGAAGFPDPSTAVADVAAAVDHLAATLAPAGSQLIYAAVSDGPVGWVHVQRNDATVVAHWAAVRHLQTAPAWRGRGVGTALMRAVSAIAREEMGLDHLRLAVRDGEGLEAFYRGLGWQTVGRWPRALRLSAADVRDEVLMYLALGA